jgi:hypothetical protein
MKVTEALPPTDHATATNQLCLSRASKAENGAGMTGFLVCTLVRLLDALLIDSNSVPGGQIVPQREEKTMFTRRDGACMSSARRAPHRSWHVCSRLSTSEFDSCSATHMATVRLRHRPPLTAPRRPRFAAECGSSACVRACKSVVAAGLLAEPVLLAWSADRRNALAQPATSEPPPIAVV